MNDINGMPVRLGWTYKCEQTGQVGRAVQYIRADVVHLLAAYGEPWQAASENLRRIERRDHVPVPPK